ncbi:hypothetical protein [Fontibacter flavus]|uniref:Uncharacterized protein n=1 Tax=Fontibacter flavus TaxID=654838 RepID=A0ABV6FQ00_9BACT
MDLHRINNLWKFLSIKNNLKVECSKNGEVNYDIIKGSLTLKHAFNPQFFQQSRLTLADRNFQDKQCQQSYMAQKKRFGIKEKIISPASKVQFFPNELLVLHHKFDLEVQKDRFGNYKVTISPFMPKNIYEILDNVNLIARTFWVKNFFAEGIRN